MAFVLKHKKVQCCFWCCKMLFIAMLWSKHGLGHGQINLVSLLNCLSLSMPLSSPNYTDQA